MTPIKAILPFAAFIAGTLLACGASQAQQAPQAQRACGSVGPIERRIVERADQDVESLRGFVWSRRGVSGIDMSIVADSLEAWRASLDCQKQVVAAAADAAVVVGSSR
ncbi:MAG: hypothetical protein ABJD97_13920 [Betaproteobacteria bacterium]